MERLCPGGSPSLIECKRLTVRGPVIFAGSTAIKGECEIVNDTGEPKELPPGTYEDQTVEL